MTLYTIHSEINWPLEQLKWPGIISSNMTNFEIASQDVAFFAILIGGIQMRNNSIQMSNKNCKYTFFFDKTYNDFHIYLDIPPHS